MGRSNIKSTISTIAFMIGVFIFVGGVFYFVWSSTSANSTNFGLCGIMIIILIISFVIFIWLSNNKEE